MNSRMSSSYDAHPHQHETSSPDVASTSLAVRELREPSVVRDAMRGGIGVYFAQRRYNREIITLRLHAQLEVETNRLAVATVAAKALDQKAFTKFINAIWLELEANLGAAVDATEAEMRAHIDSIVLKSYAAIQRYQQLHDKGDLPPAWRDRLTQREEGRTDHLIGKLDTVLDELIEQRVKLIMGGISMPRLA